MPTQILKALRNVSRTPEILRCVAQTSQWAHVTAAYLGISRLQYPFILRLRTGEQVNVEELTDLKAFWQIFLRRVYRVDSTDRAIVDLGANIGVFTLYAARCATQAKIFSVEPFPSTFRRLVNNVRNHQLETRVTCLNFAAAGSSGERLMPDAPVPSQRRALSSVASSTKISTGPQVTGKTLEAMFDENRLSHVDLVKVDIEGSEYEVFLSTPSNILVRIDRISMEYHGDSAPYSKQQLFDHICSAGFTTTWDICDAQGYGIAEMIRQA
jgi:FkbM family methyltransferase